ncbi:forkhead box protein M1 isoform X2 [Xyrichtys novacula]|uniref:Forkhead box protein M1 n=1 Tax=Xyrichtys novacula TaxID=13765 RepID=A0AAV1F189_XYRNO|nr:forkhead box protein M1 isoform X2 [Xyrichtys novacula]
MRRSPRRPLILRRRKLPFQQNDPPAAEPQPAASRPKDPSKPEASQCVSDGIRVIDHPTVSDTQVVVIPKTADLQSVIGALTAKGKECGAQGRNKFILLCENGSDPSSLDNISTGTTAEQPIKAEPVNIPQNVPPLSAVKPFKDLECRPLDDSLTNIQWLGKMNTSDMEPDSSKQPANKENQSTDPQAHQNATTKGESAKQPISERPPYSYMAMIQFAINSQKTRRMTLKEIYTWIEDHFPYFKDVAKPGWKNSIRHNLSLHDMFIRETSFDDKVSFWTIRPEANRCLTLDQVYRQQRKILPDARKTPTSSERRMKPLLPRTESYLIPLQLPVASSVFIPSSQAQYPPTCLQQKQTTSRGTKRVRIAPKVSQSDVPAPLLYHQKNKEAKIKMEEELVSIKCETPKSLPKTQACGSRRKQRLTHSLTEEPVLLCPENPFFDSGVISDVSTFQEMRDTEIEEHIQQVQQSSPDREYSFKTPVKSSNHLTSSTPSKPLCSAPTEPWKVTPVGKGSQDALDFSPIRTPGGPAVTPCHEYTTYSFSSTPFKDWPLFNSPRELLTSAPSRGADASDSPISCLRSSCSRELLEAGGSTPMNYSITEGLVLDTMNDSLSKILVDISFSCMGDDDLGTANISLSEFIPQLK